jgi:signal transduction histidine kinase/ligand-binding sensor domain-containing protein
LKSGIQWATLQRRYLRGFAVFCGTVLMFCSVLAGPLAASESHPAKTVTLPMIEGRGIRFRKLPTSAGLSQTRVSNIVQDDGGFIWFGTQNGLNRFDGYKCKVFRHDPQRPDSLSGVYINALLKDRSGFIWVASDQFLDRLDPVTESFTHYSLVEPDRNGLAITISHISQDSSGILWLSTNVGLFQLDPATKRSTRFVHDPQDSATIGDNDVTSTGEDREGTFWVATSQTLDEFDRGTGKVLRHIATPHSGVGNQFHEDRFGVFWIFYGDDGVPGILDRKSGQITRFQFNSNARQNRKRNRIYAMLEDHDGNMWFGSSDSGVLEYDGKHRRFVSYSNHPGDGDSLADNRILTLFEDREGTIWVGLHEAEPNFFTTRRPLFEKFTHQSGNPDSLAAPLVSVLYEDRDGLLWAGSDHGVMLINRNTGKYSRFNPIVSNGPTVHSIVEQGPNILWLGTDRGIKRYDRNTSALKEYPYPPGAAYACFNSIVERLLLDKDGTLWGATWEGLCHFDPATRRFTRFKPEEDIWGLDYHAIARDRDGNFWLGGEIGLHRFDPLTKRFTVYSHRPDDPHSLSANRVNSLYIDHAGTLWAGTQNGLDKFDPRTDSFSEYGEQQGMSGSVVSCVLEDRKGSLWMSTNKGLSNFDPETGSFKNYSVADGLPGDDLTGWGACSKSSTGEMFFGGFSGAVAFFPDQIADDTFVPPIVLTDFRLFGNSVPLGKHTLLTRSIGRTDEVTLSHAQNVFAIEFSALSYLNAETNRYRYRLESLEAKWNEVDGSQRVASYTALPYGTYTFRVEGATSHGHWNEPGVSLRIRILPPWWSTWWFRTACVLLIALVIQQGYQFRVGQLARQLDLRFQERLKERTRIAQDLHDTLLQNIAGLCLQIGGLSKLVISSPDLVRERLKDVRQQGEECLREARQAVWNIRSLESEGGDLAVQLRDSGERLTAGTQIQLRFRREGEPREIPLELRDHLLRIGREAIINAVRHAEAKEIEVRINFERRRITVTVSDDGIGFDPASVAGLTGHFGLATIRERAQEINAKVRLSSAPRRGTSIEVMVRL